MKPVFVKTRHVYDSYSDWYKLADLSFFESCYQDEIDWDNPDIAYITNHFAFPDGQGVHADRKCKVIFWQLERPSADWVKPTVFDEIWCSDRTMAERFGLKFVILGTHEALRDSQLDLAKLYDFAHLSYLTDRRKRVIDHLGEKMGITFAPNGWGKERDMVLRQSSAMLSVHQDEEPYIEPLRYALAVAYNMPILAEVSGDFYPFKESLGFPLPLSYRLVWLDYPEVDYGFQQNVIKALNND